MDTFQLIMRASDGHEVVVTDNLERGYNMWNPGMLERSVWMLFGREKQRLIHRRQLKKDSAL